MNDEFCIKKINDMMMRSTKPTFRSLDLIDNERGRERDFSIDSMIEILLRIIERGEGKENTGPRESIKILYNVHRIK